MNQLQIRSIPMLASSNKQQRLVDLIASGHPLLSGKIFLSDTEFPRWFETRCNFAEIASDAFLDAAGHQPGVQPKGWRSERPGVFWKPIGSWDTLFVRKCGEFWTIERERANKEALFCAGLLFARSCEGAMRLAEFCHPEGLRLGVRWEEIVSRHVYE
jgi:hypothetical protein